ncbi:hypothetical protein NQ314_003029 [Rhamnusium bicolor]|uniref:TGF-beta family profile domain-containing protein n=1 Tax=Rhamnusium bicolor TaxID=1586634 RepID=A0AAV8ZNK0_9CUCU|nr:hypothetical protein NQ314_003029 [Rhamnusium bicolor]
MLKVFIFIFILHFSFCQNADNFRKTYYFKMGKNNNEFKVNNRIYFLNHNISDYDYTHKPREDIKIQKVNEKRINNVHTAYDEKEVANYSHSSSQYCQRKEWNIEFKKLHWDDFIIAPDGFAAYDCVGKCVKPLNDDVNHIKLLHIFNNRAACCVPVNYLSLPIMFYDKFGNIVIKKYENMIATECGCR